MKIGKGYEETIYRRDTMAHKTDEKIFNLQVYKYTEIKESMGNYLNYQIHKAFYFLSFNYVEPAKVCSDNQNLHHWCTCKL